jgi:LmbE family N-acetylglucosaminyl deacetylase
MAVLAHPDDESLGVGGTLAKYAAEGVQTAVVTATRGQRGRFRGHREPPEHPGIEALARIREAELRAAARTLGVSDLTLLDYTDQDLDGAEPRTIIREIADQYRRLRPHVVLTFPPDGAYGHPDHIAISQFATAAALAAASSPPVHAVSKLYYMAWPQSTWRAYEEAFRTLV